jgi:hypothetical protein
MLRVCRISLGSRVSGTSLRNSTAGVVNQLEQTELGNLLDMPNDELMQAGNGVGARSAWVAVAGFHAWAPFLRVGQRDGRRDV